MHIETGNKSMRGSTHELHTLVCVQIKGRAQTIFGVSTEDDHVTARSVSLC